MIITNIWTNEKWKRTKFKVANRNMCARFVWVASKFRLKHFTTLTVFGSAPQNVQPNTTNRCYVHKTRTAVVGCECGVRLIVKQRLWNRQKLQQIVTFSKIFASLMICGYCIECVILWSSQWLYWIMSDYTYWMLDQIKLIRLYFWFCHFQKKVSEITYILIHFVLYGK